MKKKIMIILIIILAIILIILGGANVSKPAKEKTKTDPPVQEAKKAIVDGDMTNIEETLISQHIYKDYRIKSLRIAKRGPYYFVIFTIDNISKEKLPSTHLKLAFLDSNKKPIAEIEAEIPELPVGETTTVSIMSSNEKIYDAFDYKISKTKQ